MPIKSLFGFFRLALAKLFNRKSVETEKVVHSALDILFKGQSLGVPRDDIEPQGKLFCVGRGLACAELHYSLHVNPGPYNYQNRKITILPLEEEFLLSCKQFVDQGELYCEVPAWGNSAYARCRKNPTALACALYEPVRSIILAKIRENQNDMLIPRF